jgi:hypothetical protein
MTRTVSRPAISKAPSTTAATANGNGSSRRTQVTAGLRMKAKSTAIAAGISTSRPA